MSIKFTTAAALTAVLSAGVANAATINEYYGAAGAGSHEFETLSPLDLDTLHAGSYNVKYDGWATLNGQYNLGFATPSQGFGFNAVVDNSLQAQEGTAATRDEAAAIKVTSSRHVGGSGAPTFHASWGYYTGLRYVGFAVEEANALADVTTITLQLAMTNGQDYDDNNAIRSFLNDEAPLLSLVFGDSSTLLDLAASTHVAANTVEWNDAMGGNVTVGRHTLTWDVSGYADIASFSIGYVLPPHSVLMEVALYQTDYVAPTAVDAVPEPATAGLLALGGLAILARRRR